MSKTPKKQGDKWVIEQPLVQTLQELQTKLVEATIEKERLESEDTQLKANKTSNIANITTQFDEKIAANQALLDEQTQYVIDLQALVDAEA